MPSLTDAFQNLYTYIISIAGVISLAVLIMGGIQYLISTGDPEKLAKARKQILAALFGIVLLLSSYLILRTINPELVSFDIPKLTPIVLHPLDKPPPETKVPQLLDNVKEIAEGAKLSAEKLENSSYELKHLTDNCDCATTQSLCVCAGGSTSSACEPIKCYSENNTQPCPDGSEIKENQKRVIAWKDEMLYYKNRSLAEEQDLRDEIKKVLDEKIYYYQKNIIIEEDEEVKEYFKQEKEKVSKEKELKKRLADELKNLADAINEVEPNASELGQLPDKCLSNVEQKCQASCKGGCHDIKSGCEPAGCSGGNPCPVDEIQLQLDYIQMSRAIIESTGDIILNIIQDIIEFKTITI